MPLNAGSRARSIGYLEKNVGVARLVQRTPAREVLAAKLSFHVLNAYLEATGQKIRAVELDGFL